MRRVISILLIIFTLNLFLSSFRNLPLARFESFNSKQFDIGHAVSGFMFVVLLAIHLWLNRKAIARYFGKLGWWWIPVALGFVSVVWGGVVVTLLYT